MTTVWVLVTLGVIRPFIGEMTVNPDAIVFQSAARCLRNVNNVKKQLSNKYEYVYVACIEKDIELDK